MKKCNGINYDEPKPFTAINVDACNDCLITSDYLTLLEWVIKKTAIFGYKEFYYTKENIIKEIGYKRRRLDAMIDYFEDMGVLYVTTGKQGMNKVTFFTIFFDKLLESLPKLFRYDTFGYRAYHGNIRYHLKKQAEVLSKDKEQPITQASEDMTDWQRLYAKLSEVYTETSGSEFPQKLNSSTQSAFIKLMQSYDVKTLQGVFFEFALDVSYKRIHPKQPLMYLLTHNEKSGFKVVNDYIDRIKRDYN